MIEINAQERLKCIAICEIYSYSTQENCLCSVSLPPPNCSTESYLVTSLTSIHSTFVIAGVHRTFKSGRCISHSIWFGNKECNGEFGGWKWKGISLREVIRYSIRINKTYSLSLSKVLRIAQMLSIRILMSVVR